MADEESYKSLDGVWNKQIVWAFLGRITFFLKKKSSSSQERIMLLCTYSVFESMKKVYREIKKF